MTEQPDGREMKKGLQEAFNAVAGGYDNPSLRFFQKSAKLLPGYLRLRGDEHVLDVATGTGHAAIELAGALPKGRVTGIDFSDGMLARARAKIKERGIGNIALKRMDMQALEFPDGEFDAAVFSFSIFFVEDMEGLLKHVMRKLKPGGRVLATGFIDGTFSPQVEMFIDRVKTYGVDAPFSWRFSKPDECIALFQKVGLAGVSVDTTDLGYNLSDAGQWWDVVWNAGLRRFVSSLSPDDLKRFREEHLSEIEGLSEGEGPWLEVKVLYASGIR